MRHLDNDNNEDTEPDPVDPRLFYDRLDHRCGQDHNRYAFKKTTQDYKNMVRVTSSILGLNPNEPTH